MTTKKPYVPPPVLPGYGDQIVGGDEDTAVDKLSQLVAGNKQLVTRPHLVTALYFANATPEQAQTINTFVTALDAKKRVQIAMDSGTPIRLSADEKYGLDQMGVDYEGVEFTPRMAAAQAQRRRAVLEAEQRRKTFGTKDGKPVQVGGSGISDALGDIWDHTGAEVFDGLNAAWDWTSSTVVHGFEEVKDVLGLPDNQADPVQAASISQEERDARQADVLGKYTGAGNYKPKSDRYSGERHNMQLLGYDPDNWASVQAYRASGKDLADTSDLVESHGQDMVDQAVLYSADPQKYMNKVVKTDDMAELDDSIAMLKSKEFQSLVAQVGARKATVGNVLTSSIDPEKNPGVKQWSAAGIDLAFAFAADPTLVLLKGVKAVKFSQIAIDSTDADKVRRILTGEQKGLYASRVRNGMQSLIDSSAMIRKGADEGDDALVAAGWAKVRAETPGLEHLASEFSGGITVTGMADAASPEIFRVGKAPKPITNMEEAADYLSSAVGFARLRYGQPAAEAAYMPGQLSRFGYRRLRGALAADSAMAGIARDKRVFDLRKPDVAARVLPTVDDAVEVLSGRVIAAQQAVEASEIQAAKFADEARKAHEAERSSLARGRSTKKWDSNYPELQAVSAQTKEVSAQAASQLDRDRAALAAARAQDMAEAAAKLPPSAVRGLETSRLGEGINDARTGLLKPSAIAERTRLLHQRMTSLLPRSTAFDTSNPEGALDVFRYGQMYLTRPHANLLAGLYAAGDEGARKAILQGLHTQTLHAAGLGSTDIGKAMLARAQKSVRDEGYSSTGLDRLIDVNTGQERAAALFDTQVRTTLTLPSFQEIQKHAAKIGIWESTLGRVFNSQLVDYYMQVQKGAWLITGSNVARNVLDDLAGATVRGELGDVLKAKAIAREKDVLPARTRVVERATKPLAKVGAVYRHAQIATAKPELGLKYIEELDPDFAAHFVDQWSHLRAGDMIDPAGVHAADEITRVGLVPRKLRMTRVGFGPEEVTDDLIGSDRLAGALGRVINGNPDHAKTLLAHIKGEKDIDAVVASLRKSKDVPKMMRAGQFKMDGEWRKVVTADDREVALRQLADDQVEEFRYLFMGADGGLNMQLADHVIATGKAPDAKWVLDNLAKTGDKPPTVLAPTMLATTVDNKLESFVGGLSDLTGSLYQHLVERPITRLSSMPIFLSNYGKARYEMRGLEEAMVAEGMTPEAAATVAQKLGLQNAFSRTVKYIDDPTLRNQMDVVGRNFFAFSRATWQFLRRWGQNFIEDPARLRKGMLGMEAAEHAGLVYTDQNGDRQFIFPGSGPAMDAVNGVLGMVGLGGVGVPTADFTGRVLMLQSGLDNPTRIGLTPMVNIPMRAVFDMFPEHQSFFDDIDRFFNGAQAANRRGVLDEITPSIIKKFTSRLNDDDRDSMMASANRQAILSMAAAGMIPNVGASPDQVDEFLQRVRTQTKNRMILSAIFGLFSPAPPSQPRLEVPQAKEDWYYTKLGVRGLSDEFRELTNQMGGDYGKAATVWAKLHPDKLIYTVGTTKSTTKGALPAATAETQKWLEKNLEFMRQYKLVSAYFVPQSEGDFDSGAYNAQLELGIRQHKDLKEFYSDIRIQHAETTYYAAMAKRDEALAKHPGAAAQKNIKAQWSDYARTFRAQNPLFDAKLKSYGVSALAASDALRSLRSLVKANPKGIPGVSEAGQMVAAYDRFHEVNNSIVGRSKVALVQKKQLRSEYGSWMQQMVDAHPNLAGLAQGVFRTLDRGALEDLEN